MTAGKRFLKAPTRLPKRPRAAGVAVAAPCLWVCVGLLVGFGIAPLGADTIELASGKRLENVTIMSARWDGVQYKQGSRPAVSLKGDQVLTVERSNLILDRIRQLIDQKDFARAKASLNNLAQKPQLEAEAMYRLAKGRAQSGDPKDAAKAYKAYIDKFKGDKDWFVPYATMGMAEAYLAARNPKTAENHFKELEAFGGRWVQQARLGRGDALLASKGAAGALDARRLYDQVARSSSTSLALRQKAYVGRARAFLLQKQPEEVVKELSEKLFDKPKPETLAYTEERARASLLMGQAYMAMGGKENLEKAELWLLRVPALYGQHAAVFSAACDALVDVYGKLNNSKRAAEWKARKTAGG